MTDLLEWISCLFLSSFLCPRGALTRVCAAVIYWGVQFEEAFIETLSRLHGTKRVRANQVYQE